jgi:hypothetical protein
MAQYVNFCYQPAIYISRILPGHANLEFIIGVINNYNMGVVSQIDIQASPSNYKEHVATLYYAVVHFSYWNVVDTIEFRSTLMQGKFAKLYYNHSNFWKVSAYKNITGHKRNMEEPVLSLNDMQQMLNNDLHVEYVGSCTEMYPPPPKLQRQQCREYSDFELYYHKLQVADFWHKQNGGKPTTEDNTTNAVPAPTATTEEGEIEDSSPMDEDLAKQLRLNKLNEDEKMRRRQKQEKWNFKFHNRHRMFDFDSRDL